MAEFEYHPDICSACLHRIAPDAPVVIIDNVKEAPRYYHMKCLFYFFDIVAKLHDFPNKWKGANDDRY